MSVPLRLPLPSSELASLCTLLWWTWRHHLGLAMRRTATGAVLRTRPQSATGGASLEQLVTLNSKEEHSRNLAQQRHDTAAASRISGITPQWHYTAAVGLHSRCTAQSKPAGVQHRRGPTMHTSNTVQCVTQARESLKTANACQWLGVHPPSLPSLRKAMKEKLGLATAGALVCRRWGDCTALSRWVVCTKWHHVFPLIGHCRT
jgi:hypothetical protein